MGMVTGKEFIILGEKIKLTKEEVNERDFRASIKGFKGETIEVFDNWYDNSGNLDSMCGNLAETLKILIMPLVEYAVEMLNEHGVYTIDEAGFLEEYGSNCLDPVEEVINQLEEALNMVHQREEDEKAERAYRKAGRSRMIGGGFGVRGAMQGAVMAGSFNMATGALYSVGNFFGDIASGLKTASQKEKIYNQLKEPLKIALSECIDILCDDIREAFKSEAGMVCAVPEESKIKKALTILHNYKANRIPKEKVKEQLLVALSYNYYDIDIYDSLFFEFGDKNKSIQDMANYFCLPFELVVGRFIEGNIERIYLKHLEEFENTSNNRVRVLQFENEIENALKEIKECCEEYGIDYEDVPRVYDCESLLRKCDWLKRSFRGQVFSSIESKQEIEKYYTKWESSFRFNENFNAQKILEDMECENNEFQKEILDFFSREIDRRNPKKIYSNIEDIINDTFGVKKAEKFKSIFMDGRVSNFSDSTVDVTGVPLVKSCPEANQNVGSGLLISSKYLVFENDANERVSYPVEDIVSIGCVKKDMANIELKDGSKTEAWLYMKDYSLKRQIQVCEILTKVISLLQDLAPYDRENLGRILFGNTSCTCGNLLYSDEKICPNCNRIKMPDGNFVESVKCHNCGKILPFSAKFCSWCGGTTRQE